MSAGETSEPALQAVWSAYAGGTGHLTAPQFFRLCDDAGLAGAAGSALPTEVLPTTFTRHAFKKGPERVMGLDARALGLAIADMEVIAGPIPPTTLLQLITALAPPPTPDAATHGTSPNGQLEGSSTTQPVADSSPSSPAVQVAGQQSNILFHLQSLGKARPQGMRPGSVQGPASPTPASPPASRQGRFAFASASGSTPVAASYPSPSRSNLDSPATRSVASPGMGAARPVRPHTTAIAEAQTQAAAASNVRLPQVGAMAATSPGQQPHTQSPNGVRSLSPGQRPSTTAVTSRTSPYIAHLGPTVSAWHNGPGRLWRGTPPDQQPPPHPPFTLPAGMQPTYPASTPTDLKEAWAAHGLDGLEAVFESNQLLLDEAMVAAAQPGPPLALRLLDRLARLEEVAGLALVRCDELENQLGTSGIGQQVASLRIWVGEVEDGTRVSTNTAMDKVEELRQKLEAAEAARSSDAAIAAKAAADQAAGLEALRAALASSEHAHAQRYSALEASVSELKAAQAKQAAELESKVAAERSAADTSLSDTLRTLRSELEQSAADAVAALSAKMDAALAQETQERAAGDEKTMAAVHTGLDEVAADAEALARAQALKVSALEAAISSSASGMEQLHTQFAALEERVSAAAAAPVSTAVDSEAVLAVSKATQGLEVQVGAHTEVLAAVQGRLDQHADGAVKLAEEQAQMLQAMEARIAELGAQVAQAAAAAQLAAGVATASDRPSGTALTALHGRVEAAEERAAEQQDSLSALQIDMAEVLQAIQEHNVKLRDQEAGSGGRSSALAQPQAAGPSAQDVTQLAQELGELSSVLHAELSALQTRVQVVEHATQEAKLHAADWQMQAGTRSAAAAAGGGIEGAATDEDVRQGVTALVQRTDALERATVARVEDLLAQHADLATAIETVAAEVAHMQEQGGYDSTSGAAPAAANSGRGPSAGSLKHAKILTSRVEAVASAVSALWVAVDALTARMSGMRSETKAHAEAGAASGAAAGAGAIAAQMAQVVGTLQGQVSEQVGQLQAQLDVLSAQAKDRSSSFRDRGGPLATMTSFRGTERSSGPTRAAMQGYVSTEQLDSVHERLAALEVSSLDLPGITERLEQLEHTMMRTAAAASGPITAAATPAADFGTAMEQRVAALEAAVGALMRERKSVKILEPSSPIGKAQQPAGVGSGGQPLKLTRKLLKKLLDRISALEDGARANWIAHDALTAQVCDVAALAGRVEQGAIEVAAAQEQLSAAHHQHMSSHKHVRVASEPPTPQHADAAAGGPAASGASGPVVESTEGLVTTLANHVSVVDAELTTIKQRVQVLEGREQSMLEAVQDLLGEITAAEASGAAGVSGSASTAGEVPVNFSRTASRAISRAIGTMPSRSSSMPGFALGDARSHSVRWQEGMDELQDAAHHESSPLGRPSGAAAVVPGGAPDSRPTSQPQVQVTSFGAEGAPTNLRAIKTSTSGVHVYPGVEHAAAAAMRALNEPGAMDTSPSSLTGTSAWRDIKAALNASAPAALQSMPGSEAPSRPVSAGRGREESRPGSPGATAGRGVGTGGADLARDTQKQMYEMQKVMVEVARRHNKLGDRVTKLEKGVKNRMDIQEKLFIKIARQVDELNRSNNQGTGAGSAGQQLASHSSFKGGDAAMTLSQAH